MKLIRGRLMHHILRMVGCELNKESFHPTGSSQEETPNPSRPLYIIIPLYRHPELLASLCKGLKECESEIVDCHGEVIFVNDSPGDNDLDKAIKEACVDLNGCGVVTATLANSHNIGYLQSANQGLRAAVEKGRDVLLLNSDVILFAGCIKEMRRVAYCDHMIGFVNPRSNNATICSIPTINADVEPNDGHRFYETVKKYLADFQYLPTAVGFCLYIKSTILGEFGIFDDIYGMGYNEENDLIMRANRSGYRAVVANGAYAHHLGSSSFGSQTRKLLDERNTAILNTRYPEYQRIVSEYFQQADRQYEKMLTSLVPDNNGKIAIALDLSGLTEEFTGTAQMAVNIAKGQASIDSPFILHAICSHRVAKFHGIYNIQGLYVVNPENAPIYALALRLGQPFSRADVIRMSQLAILNVYFMLDTIAWDCGYLSCSELDEVWRHVMRYADGVIYNSRFTMNQFGLRFSKRKNLRELVSLHSTDPAEYVEGRKYEGLHKHILVVGNHLAHKFVRETVDALSSAFPQERIYAIGMSKHSSPMVTALIAGEIPTEVMERLYNESMCVIYPSHYEGFGFPVVKAVSHGKRTYLRSGPLADEIVQNIATSWLLTPYETTQGLLAQLRADIPLIRQGVLSDVCGMVSLGSTRSWGDSAAEIANWLNELLIHPADLIHVRERIHDIQLSHSGFYDQLMNVYSSTSWRITAPMRRLMDTIKRHSRA